MSNHNNQSMTKDAKYINPLMDWSFKYLFGRESVKDILIGFLNAVMQGEYTIQDVKYLNNEHPRQQDEGKTIIYDLLCQTDKDEYVIVEMQNREQCNFADRALYYTSRAIAEQGIKGEWDYQLKAVYGIFFMNFELIHEDGKNPNQSRTEVALVDIETGKVFNRKMKQIFIELPRFNKTEEECESSYDRWIYILKNMETMQTMPFVNREAVFARLDTVASMAQMSKTDRVEYDAELKTYRDLFNKIDFAEQKGLKDGIVRGIAQGIAQGILQSAKLMLQSGMSREQVIKILGLSQDQASQI